MVCIALSLVFTYYKRENGSAVSLKWVIYAVILFISNGMCSVFMRMQQIRFDGKVDGIYMVVSLAVVLVILLAMALIREGKGFFRYSKMHFMVRSLRSVQRYCKLFHASLSAAYRRLGLLSRVKCGRPCSDLCFLACNFPREVLEKSIGRLYIRNNIYGAYQYQIKNARRYALRFLFLN